MSKMRLMAISLMAILFLAGCSPTRMTGRKFTKTSRCPVHNVEMKEVSVIYGYPNEELLQKAERGEVILGGCIIGKYKTGYICPVDKKAYYLR